MMVRPHDAELTPAERECGPSQFQRNEIAADAATVDGIEQVFRDHLLMALSEARTMSSRMDANLREKLIDSLSKQFHPDGFAGDLFTEAFHDIKQGLDDQLEEVNATQMAFKVAS